MKTWICVFIFSLGFCVIDGQQFSRPGRYGDRCTSSTRSSTCNSDSKLTCVNEFCRCSREEEIFDYVRDQCAIKEGENCNPPKFDFGEYNPCVSNGFCSENSRVCVCASHSYPDGQGRCLRKKNFGDLCVQTSQCDDLKYLSCLEIIDGVGRCSCKLSSFDEYYQICRRRVGDACLRSKDCVKDAECIQSKCVCKTNYSETSGKSCGLAYGQPCGGVDDTSCSDIYFACVNGACRCKNPSYEVYDNSTKNCLSLVGGLCHLFLSSKTRQPLKLKSCVKNAECVRRDLSPLSQCECGKGFVETISGHCRLPYGATCKTFGQKDALECIDPLVCKNMKCECQNENDVYDREDKTCKRITGSICSKNTDCVPNSKCEKSRCRCAPGFLPTFRGGCESEPIGSFASAQEQYVNVIPAPDFGIDNYY